MLILSVLLLSVAVLLGVVFRMASLGAVIFAFDPPLLNTMQAGIQRNISPWLWDAVFLPVLEQPSWLLPAVSGAALLGLGLWLQRGR